MNNYPKGTGLWAGGNFTIAANSGGVGFPESGLMCKGDNSLGQCDFPIELSEYFIGHKSMKTYHLV